MLNILNYALLPYMEVLVKSSTFFSIKKYCPLSNLKTRKICAIISTSYFFSPKKVSKKGFGLRKMRGFCFLATAAPKKLAAPPSGGGAAPNPFGSNSFWLHPPPLKQNLHFSKAGLATLGVLCFVPHFNIYYSK
jgi:hypothetical protein